MATRGEFSGGAGLVQPQQYGNETMQQECWEVYATNSAGTDGSETTTVARERIGRPRETYTPGSET